MTDLYKKVPIGSRAQHFLYEPGRLKLPGNQLITSDDKCNSRLVQIEPLSTGLLSISASLSLWVLLDDQLDE